LNPNETEFPIKTTLSSLSLFFGKARAQLAPGALRREAPLSALEREVVMDCE
jgi:hypothetical protein